MSKPKPNSRTNHLTKGLTDDENKTILRLVKIIIENEQMTVDHLHMRKPSLSITRNLKTLQTFIKKHSEVFKTETKTGYIKINPHILPKITYLNNSFLHNVKCTVEKSDIGFGFLLTEDGETVYFGANVFEDGENQNLSTALQLGDVVIVDAVVAKAQFNAHWEATKVKRINNNSAITYSLNSEKGDVINKHTLMLENQISVSIPADVTSQVAIRPLDSVLCNVVKVRDGYWLATKIFVTLRHRSGEEFEPEVILENIIEDYVGCIDRLTSTYGFIKHGMSEEDHIYFTHDAVKSEKNTTSGLLTDFLCIGDQVICNADSIDNFTCNYRANIVTIIEKIDIVETISGSTMQNCEGTIMKLKPSDGILLFGSDKTWTEVYFSVEEFYRDGHLVQRLDWCLEVGGKVMFDAVKQGDYGKCKWKALLVWRGNKPRIGTRIDKRRMVEEELIKKFPLFNAEFQISDVPIVTITSKKEKEVEVSDDSSVVVGKDDEKTEFKCMIAEDDTNSKVKRKRLRKKMKKNKSVNSQSSEANGNKCDDEIEIQSQVGDLGEPEVDETIAEMVPGYCEKIGRIGEFDVKFRTDVRSLMEELGKVIPDVEVKSDESVTSCDMSFEKATPEVEIETYETETSISDEESENETFDMSLLEKEVPEVEKIKNEAFHIVSKKAIPAVEIDTSEKAKSEVVAHETFDLLFEKAIPDVESKTYETETCKITFEKAKSEVEAKNETVEALPDVGIDTCETDTYHILSFKKEIPDIETETQKTETYDFLSFETEKPEVVTKELDGFDAQLNKYMYNYPIITKQHAKIKDNSVDASTQTIFTGEIFCSHVYHE